VHRGIGSSGTELVDIEVEDDLAILCGGFGARLFDVTQATEPLFVGSAGSRCQHAAHGPLLPNGSRTLFITHHGDSYIPTPSIKSFAWDGQNGTAELASETQAGLLYEGIAYDSGYLFAAAHTDGLVVHQVGADASLTPVGSLGGLGNAWKVEVQAQIAYVVDSEVGVHLVDISDPAAPALLTTVTTTASPRDIALVSDRMYVALGGLGIDVFDISTAAGPVPDLTWVTTIPTLGSAQSVSVEGPVLAVAAWNHVATYDTESFAPLATERTRGGAEFEQDLGVAMKGDLVYVAEWNDLHVLEHRDGYVAPDITLDRELYAFDPDVAGSAAVVVRNRGRAELRVCGAMVGNSAYQANGASLVIAPGEADFFEVAFSPPAPPSASTLTLITNDPDANQASFDVLLSAEASPTALKVGDSLTDSFAFLDPSGAGQLSGLEGKVVVLSYFALF